MWAVKVALALVLALAQMGTDTLILSTVNAELDLAVLCFVVICFYEDILFFKFSLSVNSYIFRSPDVCQTHHRSVVSICTKSVTRK